ncbi:hypothetical protein OS493_024335 [Desmophyllum pertusum]|uniref:Uncharacterized protein n=1 Tax=Desmophyllum pertusum TaxID=174260 RepID=A0A9W9YLJ9_9CNID|nr:hypothetical protein OS493_024335 [Desmophyllum pertusum]
MPHGAGSLKISQLAQHPRTGWDGWLKLGRKVLPSELLIGTTHIILAEARQ